MYEIRDVIYTGYESPFRDLEISIKAALNAHRNCYMNRVCFWITPSIIAIRTDGKLLAMMNDCPLVEVEVTDRGLVEVVPQSQEYPCTSITHYNSLRDGPDQHTIQLNRWIEWANGYNAELEYKEHIMTMIFIDP